MTRRAFLKEKLAFALTYDLESVVHTIHHRRSLAASISPVDDQSHAAFVFLMNQLGVGGVLDNFVFVVHRHREDGIILGSRLLVGRMNVNGPGKFFFNSLKAALLT